MKLGIGLPNTLGVTVDRELMLRWARLADEAGFAALGTIDQPGHDTWDPLVTLAAAAAVTERVDLVTTILQLPNRNEVLVAKQAAVIDRLSGGRLTLGVAQGGRESDYAVLGADFDGRSERFERQIEQIREIWARAHDSSYETAVLGPAPAQRPGPAIWAGALQPKAIERAVRAADGFVFGSAGSAVMTASVPHLRAAFEAHGKPAATIAGLAYVAVGEDVDETLAQAAHYLVRYYGDGLWTEPANLIHHGPPGKVVDEIAAYSGTGLDLLIVFPLIPELGQVESLAEHVLPLFPSSS